MGKGIETNNENGSLVPEEDFEYEKQLAEEERRKREQAEERTRQREEELRRKRRAEREARDRRIAQDRLDLIKMKQGIADESETIEEVHTEHRELHGKEKLVNIWYHDKMWIILGTFLFVVVAFLVYDTVTRVQADLNVLLICDNALASEQSCELLAQRIERYTPDLNGDGQVDVTVISCPMNDQKYDQYYTNNSQKFFANLQQGRMIMVITDDNTDPDLQALMVDDLAEAIPGNRYIDERGLSLDMAFLARELKCENMPKGVHLCLRRPVNTLDDKIEKMQANYDINLEVLKALAEDLQKEADESGDKGIQNSSEAAAPESSEAEDSK